MAASFYVDNINITSGLAALPMPPGAGERVVAAQPAKLVYVVENDRISSVITALIVRKNLGGHVQCYANGQDAFNELATAVWAAQNVPHLVLLDLDMPLMDGWEFLDALAGLLPAPPTTVLVLTSSIHPGDLARAAGYSAVKGFFTKPLDEGSVASLQELFRQADNPAAGPWSLPLNFAPEPFSQA